MVQENEGSSGAVREALDMSSVPDVCDDVVFPDNASVIEIRKVQSDLNSINQRIALLEGKQSLLYDRVNKLTLDQNSLEAKLTSYRNDLTLHGFENIKLSHEIDLLKK